MNTFKILWAHVRLNAYLLAWGMWRGECQYTYYGRDGKLLILAASKTLKVENGQSFGTTRCFYRRPLLK
jgi:hypothetical protein